MQEAIQRDFGAATDDINDSVSRRRWLQIMGASLALGGMSGCRYEEEQIAPFAFRPQNRIPGVPVHFASIIDFCGVAQPLVATCYDGRPIKLDGNKEHPSSKGASTKFTQARILDLYDPDRLRFPSKTLDPTIKLKDAKSEEVSFESIVEAGQKMLADPGSVAIISEQIGSPSLERMRQALVAKGAKWFTVNNVNNDNAMAGCKAAFGKPYNMHYAMDKAAVVVSIDADPLGSDPGGLGNNINFVKGRDADHGHMNRLYAIESQFTTTGAAADHRISVQSKKIASFVGALAAAVQAATKGGTVDASLSYRDKVLACMAQDLKDNAGKGVIVCGEKQPPEVHAAVHAINDALGNNGSTILFTDAVDAEQLGSLESLKAFVDGASGIKSLIVIGGNPVYGAPAVMELGKAIAGIENSIHLSQYRNETSATCKLVSNVAHQLESWSDGWAQDGSVCVGQPLIRPLFDGKSVLETLAAFAGMEKTDGLEIVKETVGLSGVAWDKVVHDGFVDGSAAKPVAVSFSGESNIAASDDWKSEWDESFEVVFSPSASVYDGRFANNAWLQELPDFHTKLTWDNAALVSPKTAQKHGWRTGQKITVTVGDASVSLPVVIQPGQAHGSIGLELGYGREMAGRVGGDVTSSIASVGVNVGALRTTDGWNFAEVEKPDSTGTMVRLALVQEPWDIDPIGRGEIQSRMFRNKELKEGDRSGLIREGTFESYKSFMAHHPADHGHDDDHDHDDHGHGDDGHAHEGDGHSSHKPKSTALPVITNVSYIKEDDAHDDDHGHGHKAQWPEAFHMHHALFDITPGAREDYKQANPEYSNMWGMGIDLNKCVGCNACVIACQAENNVPVVGKDQVCRGREMHWLRMDRYYGQNLYNDEAAEEDDKQMVHQPVACHHCENAPCETVCPVAATVHSREGLNDMVYNRCIGTRYCGNNCPYKVRRFNYFNYSDAVTFLKYPGADKLSSSDRAIQNLMMNPEVTIRSRGVMEKCSYCVQRIQNVKIKAKSEGNRPIGPNEITVACQDACPCQAITFGDLNNKKSDVRKAHDSPRAYTMLEELNNHPRTKYLARVRNPHPALIDRDDRNSVRGHYKEVAKKTDTDTPAAATSEMTKPAATDEHKNEGAAEAAGH